MGRGRPGVVVTGRGGRRKEAGMQEGRGKREASDRQYINKSYLHEKIGDKKDHSY